MSQAQISMTELVELAAVDTDLFASTFFPRTVRRDPPAFSQRFWRLLDNPQARFINALMFRGAGKTTRLRIYTAKRIAYGLSHTVLYIGKSEGHAVRSVDWIRRQVKYNNLLAQTFGLRPGDKFQGTEAEIVNSVDGSSTWLVAVGIEGSVRGLNIDDYRPDLIVLDDVIADENAATPEGRQKLTELILGAIKDSLAAPGDSPNAQLVMLNTAIARDDPAMNALTDPEWTSIRIPCWTEETVDLSIDDQVSVWPEMFPTQALREQKKHALARGQGHIFAREMECRIQAVETSPLRREWLNLVDIFPPREDLRVVMACDPVPKPTAAQVAKNLHGKDYEVFQIWGRRKGQYFLLDWLRNRGHDPSWSIFAFFTLLNRWKPYSLEIDAVAYQSTLAWILQEEMKKRGVYCVVNEISDNRSKYHKIVDTYSGPASAGQLFIPRKYAEFISQWTDYPGVSHDDDLDCGQMAVRALSREWFGDIAAEDDEAQEPLEITEWCP